MINRDIVEGLRNALSRGYTLEQAMMSFYNAGYKKEDIEESARALHEHPSQPLSHLQKSTPKGITKPVTKPIPSKYHPTPQPTPPKVSETKGKPETQGKQIISKYEEKTTTKGKLGIILLIAALFVLLLVLAGIFLFRKELIDFFNSLF